MPKTKRDLGAIRANWIALVTQIGDCTEVEVLEMLEAEQNNERRQSILLRLHQRLNKLRADRERQTLLDGGDLNIAALVRTASV